MHSFGYDASWAAELRYYPYGWERSIAGPQVTSYRFTGQRKEHATKLYHYRARWYDPLVGRFISPAPIVPEPGNPQALNRYAYVYNNPLRYTDPTGYFTEEEVCEYWGYCTEEEARAGLGNLFFIIWGTDIT